MPEPHADAPKPPDKDPAEGGRDSGFGAPDPQGGHVGKGKSAVDGDAPPQAAGDPSI